MASTTRLLLPTTALLTLPLTSSMAQDITAADLGSSTGAVRSQTSAFRLPFDRELRPSFLQFGRTKIDISLDYSIYHAEGLTIGRGSNGDSTVQEMGLSIGANVGANWQATYSPAFVTYSNPSLRDHLSHKFELSGSTQNGIWTTDLSQTLSITDDTRFETGQQTKDQVYGTQVGIGAPVNTYMGFRTQFQQSLRYSASFNDSREWSNSTGLTIRVLPSLTAGPNAGIGYVDTNPGANTQFTTFGSNADWRLSKKLSFNGSVGVDFRKLDKANAETQRQGTHSVGLLYQPFDQTRLALTSSRSVGSSYFSNISTVSQQWQVSLSQRVLVRYSVSLAYSEANNRYTSEEGRVGREDELTNWDVSLNANLLPRLRSSVFYRISENKSASVGFSGRSEQYGARFGYSF